MPAGPRFAIYFVPVAGSALYRFGAAVLGYDCYTGEPVTRSRDLGLTEADWAALTAEPRTYGFHATLKAPFRLRSEIEPADLLAAVQALAASITTVPVFEPAVQLIAGFTAIVPRSASPAIDSLAAHCVKTLDHFRLPLTEAERDRRLAAGLSPSQAANLERWGYPYVFEEFRFHMTLTGRIAAHRRAEVHSLLQNEFAHRCGFDLIRLDRLAVALQGQPNTPFRIIGQVPLHAPR